MKNSEAEIERNKQEALDWLVLLRSPDLSEQQEQEFFEWLDSSLLHQQSFIWAESLWQRGGALSKVRVSKPATKSWFKLDIAWMMPGLAGACAIALAVVIWPFSNTEVKEDLYESAAGKSQTATLLDGSELVLHADSRVRCMMEEATFRRCELEKGEVFFKVTKDASRPFTVRADGALVRVVGTQFSVQRKAGGGTVTVLEGKVAVQQASTEHWDVDRAIVELVKNQQLAFTSSIGAPVDVDSARLLSWKEGMFVFEGETLAQVITELSRFYEVDIKLESRALGERRLVVALPLSNDLISNITVISEAIGLAFRHSTDSNTVVLYQPK